VSAEVLHLLRLAHIIAMGTFLARLHKNLQAYPLEHVSSFSFTIDHDTTLTRIEHIEQILRSKHHLEEVDHLALTRLEQRRIWLKQSSPTNIASLLSLEQQVIHGDYQESNLFFDEGRVSAIIDWDFACPALRAWEVFRSTPVGVHEGLR
jgi:Ser/Thr protein kinase RdoA (MazF antagonist)